MNYTKNHSAESIKREISAIIRELKDPRLEKGFISVSKIEVTKKNSSCRIFISALEGYDYAVDAVKCLQGAAGHIRKVLGERLSLRYIPTLVFIATDSVRQGADILKKIDEISKNELSKEGT